MSSNMYCSPIKLSAQSNEADKELISPEINENFSFSALGTDVSIRKETLTPGPVYYPGDSHNRRTPGIDRPPQLRSLGAFEHSVNLERKNELLQNSILIEESDYHDYEIMYGEGSNNMNISGPHLTVPALDDSLRFIHDLTQHKDEYVSPGKNVHSQPFYPQHHYSTTSNSIVVSGASHTGTSGNSRLDSTERVPPLARGPHFQHRLETESQSQHNYHLQTLVENRPFTGDPTPKMSDRTRQYPGRNQNNFTLDYSKHPSHRHRLHNSYHGSYFHEYQNRDQSEGGYLFGVSNSKIDFSSLTEPQTSIKIPESVSNLRSSSPKSRDLVESPVSKSIYKNFLKGFKTREGESFSEAIAYALAELSNIPEKIRWRAYIDVADTLKRNSHYGDARSYYKKVCEEYPYLNQGWLEWSKMEEECGNLEQSLMILRRGARANSYNEVLLTKAIKQHERLNNLTGAREMLGKLQEEAIDTTWRTVLEGSLLESRAGNIAMARKLLTALMTRVSWYGPIYHEAFRLEEKAEYFDRALAVVQKGLQELPRYGPLWFGLLRIMERQDIFEEATNWTTGDVLPLLQRTRSESQKAVRSISRELVWKIHFEQAQIEERAMEIVALGRHLSTGKPLASCRHELSLATRKCYAQSLMTCPANLRWKVYLAGARLEMTAEQISTAHLLLRQAKIEVPEKSKYHVYLECSRLEEFLGNIDSARKILSVARKEIKNEWKLYLEAVLVEARAGNMRGAIYLADKALSMDSGSGRLWALLVQLVHRCEWKNHYISENVKNEKEIQYDHLDGVDITAPPNYKIPSKYTILCRALCVVPKSGEVWCEGARTLVNPLSMKYFDLGKAQKYLSFSIQFTPQYGDSFIEYIRLEMLCQVVLPRVLVFLGVPVSYFFSTIGIFDPESDTARLIKSPRELIEIAFAGTQNLRSSRYSSMSLAKSGQLDIGHCKTALEKVSLQNLTRRCINADPNYGTAWFYCRSRPFDTPSAVIRSACSILVHELISAQSVYVAAIVAYVIRILTKVSAESKKVEHPEAGNEQTFDLDAWLNNFNISQNAHEESKEGDDFVPPFIVKEGGAFSSHDFITALIKLNRVMYTKDISSDEKRKILFGVDQITP